MISYIRGTLIEKTPPTLIVETNSLGYEVTASMQTFYQLPPIGSDVLIHLYLMFKEEKQALYGFLCPKERRLFLELLKVNKIGPKVALAMLSELDVPQMIQVITQGNIEALKHIPGIGKKTAERLLLEMKDRLANVFSTSKTEIAQGASRSLARQQQETIQALVSLGYKPQIAHDIVSNIQESDLSTESMIRIALQAIRQ